MDHCLCGSKKCERAKDAGIYGKFQRDSKPTPDSIDSQKSLLLILNLPIDNNVLATSEKKKETEQPSCELKMPTTEYCPVSVCLLACRLCYGKNTFYHIRIIKRVTK